MNPVFPAPPVLSPSPRLESVAEYLAPPPPLNLSTLPAVPDLPAEPPAGLEAQANPAPRELLARHVLAAEVLAVAPCPMEPTPPNRIQPLLLDEPEVVPLEAKEQATPDRIDPRESTDSLEALLRPLEQPPVSEPATEV